MNRLEAFEEYYKLASFVQAYDGYFVSMKAWGVTVSGAAIAVGFSQVVASSRSAQVVVFGVAFLLALAFWVSETVFKMLQLAHIYRLAEMERALANGADLAGPAILSSFSHGQKRDRMNSRWRHVLFFPHVMLPHVVFAGLSAVLVVLAVMNRLRPV